MEHPHSSTLRNIRKSGKHPSLDECTMMQSSCKPVHLPRQIAAAADCVNVTALYDLHQGKLQ